MNKKLVHYSKIREKGMSKRDEKIYNKSNNTIFLDVSEYGKTGHLFYTDLKTLIIDEKLPERYLLNIYNSTAENVYINNEENLDGYTFSFDNFLKYRTIFNFIWNSNVHDINLNIVLNNDVLKLKLDSLKYLKISSDNPKMLLQCKKSKETINYEIDKLGNKKVIYEKYIITNDDIENDVLDLRKFNKYKNISLSDDLRVDTLIIDKEILKNIKKIPLDGSEVYDRIIPSNLKIVENNNMKLMPFDKTFNVINICTYTKDNKYYIYIKNDIDEIIVYIDNNDNIKVISKKDLLKDKSIEDVIFRFRDNYYFNFIDAKVNLILIKYKNGKYKVLDFDKVYDFNYYFINFISSSFKTSVVNADIYKNKDFIKIFKDENFNNKTFYQILEEYDKYKEYLNTIKKIGLTYKALYYLNKHNYKFSLDEITGKEIKYFNELGSDYVKKKSKIKRN